MRLKEFFRDLSKLVTEYWVEVGIFVIAIGIGFEIVRRLFIWFG